MYEGSIIIFGRPGSGKGTQGKMIAQYTNRLHYSSGDHFRNIAHEQSPLAQHIHAIMGTGNLVDDETTFSLVGEKVREMLGESNYRSLVLDGIPRNKGQVNRTLQLCNDLGYPVDAVVYFVLDRDKAIERMVGRKTGGVQRADDNLATAIKRQEVYERETVPALELLAQQYPIIEVSALPSADQVTRNVLNALSADKKSQLEERVLQ